MYILSVPPAAVQADPVIFGVAVPPTHAAKMVSTPLMVFDEVQGVG
jgi:hypothetical protein